MSFDPIRTRYEAVSPSEATLRVSQGLKRVQRLSFSRQDLLLVEERLVRSGVGSPDDIYAVIRKVRESLCDQERIAELQDMLIDAHLEEFFAKSQASISDLEKSVVKKLAKKLSHEHRFYEIDQYLSQIELNGYGRAMASYHNIYAQGKIGHVWIGFASITELALFAAVITYCQSGFERIMVCSLAFAYATLRIHLLQITSEHKASFNVLKSTVDAVRVAISDRTFIWSERNDEHDQQVRSFYRDEVRSLMTTIKFWLMQAIAVGEIIRVVL